MLLLDDRWDESRLLQLLLDNEFAFAVSMQENGERNWKEPLFLLSTCEITTVDDLDNYFNENASRLGQLVASIGTRIEFSEVSPLLILWIAALVSRADAMTSSAAAEIRAILDQYGLFPEDERDAIADFVVTKRYYH